MTDFRRAQWAILASLSLLIVITIILTAAYIAVDNNSTEAMCLRYGFTDYRIVLPRWDSAGHFCTREVDGNVLVCGIDELMEGGCQ